MEGQDLTSHFQGKPLNLDLPTRILEIMAAKKSTTTCLQPREPDEINICPPNSLLGRHRGLEPEQIKARTIPGQRTVGTGISHLQGRHWAYLSQLPLL